MTGEAASRVLWTAGHSTVAGEAFAEMLADAGVQVAADIRRFPASRRHPQFNAEAMKESLAAMGIEYRHLPALGGRRSRRKDTESPNHGWRVDAFNAYADHLATAEGEQALAELESLAATRPTCIFCAEAHPSKCHRRVVSDVFVARGWEVRHLLGGGRIQVHAMPDFARVDQGRVTYPGETLF